MAQLVHYTPNDLLKDFKRLLNPSTSSWVEDASHVETGQWIPAVDIEENEGSLVIRADLPGMDKDAISISVKDDMLSLTGERKSEVEEKSERFSRTERVYGRFSRRFSLPDFADTNAIEASMKKGVLEITIPKKPEAGSRLIEVKEHE